MSWCPRAVTLWRSTALRLALAAFVVYNINLRPVSSADTFPTRYLPISILTEFDLDLDEFPFLIKAEHPFPGAENAGLPYYLQAAARASDVRVSGHARDPRDTCLRPPGPARTAR